MRNRRCKLTYALSRISSSGTWKLNRAGADAIFAPCSLAFSLHLDSPGFAPRSSDALLRRQFVPARWLQFIRSSQELEDAKFGIRGLPAWRHARRAQFKAFPMDRFIDRTDARRREKTTFKRLLRDRKTSQPRPQFETATLAQKPKQGTCVGNQASRCSTASGCKTGASDRALDPATLIASAGRPRSLSRKRSGNSRGNGQ